MKTRNPIAKAVRLMRPQIMRDKSKVVNNRLVYQDWDDYEDREVLPPQQYGIGENDGI